MSGNEPGLPEVAIATQGVLNIFGRHGSDAIATVQQNKFSKQEVLEQYDCVIDVADVSLEIQRGEIFFVMGLSGSGKSTLVRHINRLLEPTEGGVEVNSENVLALSPAALRRYRNEHIAMVFQNFALMPHRSVLDNNAMRLEIRRIPKNQRRQTALKVLELVELRGWENKFADELSGGMQQRVGLARALSVDSEILLMDEPFSALDPLIRRQLQDEFIQLVSAVD